MMDSTDREILNRIQREVPLEREPFEAIGRELGIAGDEVIRRIEALKRGRVIRQISAIFDTRVLGYESSLVAARIPAHGLNEGAKAINSHPGVSHNYERNNALDRKSTRLNSSHANISYAVFCLKKKKKTTYRLK